MEVTVEAVRHRVAATVVKMPFFNPAAQDRDSDPGRSASDGAWRKPSVKEILDSYDAKAPLERASTIPAPWYVDRADRRARAADGLLAHLADGRRASTSSRSPGRYVTDRAGGRADRRRARRGRRAARLLQRLPPPRGRGHDGARRQGADPALPVPRLDLLARGRAARARRTSRACATSTRARTASCRSRRRRGRSSSSCASTRGGPSLEQSLGAASSASSRRSVSSASTSSSGAAGRFDCNWKVFVDNYLDGGYHVPYLHKGLDSVLDYSQYTIETGDALVPAVEPDRHSKRRRRRARCAGATRRSTTGSIRTS